MRTALTRRIVGSGFHAAAWQLRFGQRDGVVKAREFAVLVAQRRNDQENRDAFAVFAQVPSLKLAASVTRSVAQPLFGSIVLDIFPGAKAGDVAPHHIARAEAQKLLRRPAPGFNVAAMISGAPGPSCLATVPSFSTHGAAGPTMRLRRLKHCSDELCDGAQGVLDFFELGRLVEEIIGPIGHGLAAILLVGVIRQHDHWKER